VYLVVRSQEFANAARGFVSVLGAGLGPLDPEAQAVEHLHRLCSDWEEREASYREGMKQQEEERNALSAQAMAARDTVDVLRMKKDAMETEVAMEKRRRADMESDMTAMRRNMREMERLERENAMLQQQLRSTEGRVRVKNAAPPVPSSAASIRQIAELECRPLRLVDGAERMALEKKLLLKWHPDKQPCANHTSLATQVMQELQNRWEWA